MAAASSPARVCGEWRSISENTATGDMPMARQVLAMRTAISPRFAIRSLRIGKQSLYCRLRARLAQNRFQHKLRAGANSEIVGQVHPADNSSGVDEKFSRSSNVAAVLAGFGVQNSVAANHLRRRIGQERISVSSGAAELVRLLGRIDTDGRDFNTVLMKFAEMLFETP
jgi:hypothetical protein